MQYDEVNEINKREKKPGESREEFLEILKVVGGQIWCTTQQLASKRSVTSKVTISLLPFHLKVVSHPPLRNGTTVEVDEVAFYFFPLILSHKFATPLEKNQKFPFVNLFSFSLLHSFEVERTTLLIVAFFSHMSTLHF